MTLQVRAPQTSTTLPSSSPDIALTLLSNDDKEITFTNVEMLTLRLKSAYFNSSVSFNPSTKTKKVDFSFEQLTLLKNIIFYPTRIQLPFDLLTAFNLALLDSYFMIDLKEYYVKPFTEYLQKLKFSSLDVNDYEIIKTLLLLNLEDIKAASIINRLETKDYEEFFDQIKILARDNDPHLVKAISRYSLKALFDNHIPHLDNLTKLDWSNTPATKNYLSKVIAPLTSLNLRGSKIGGTAFLSLFPHLQHLDLRSINCEDLSLQDLTGLRELTHLYLGNNLHKINFRQFPALPKLKHLELSSQIKGHHHQNLTHNFEFLVKLPLLTLKLGSQNFDDRISEYLPTTIEHLQINSSMITKDGILNILDRLSLQTLDFYFHNSEWNRDIIKELFQTSIKTLYLDKFDKLFDTTDYPLSKSIEFLSISKLSYRKQSLDFAHRILSKSPNLKHLITNLYSVEYFQSLPQTLPHLEHLELHNGRIPLSPIFTSLLTQFHSLKHISINDFQFPEHIEHLSLLENNSTIQSLVLTDWNVARPYSSIDLHFLVGKLPTLQKLVINPPQTGVKGSLISFFVTMSYLDPKSSCRHSLRELDLSNNQITDADLVYIVKCFPKVEHLNLSGTQITDAALQTLSLLPLITLNVERTNVTKWI